MRRDDASTRSSLRLTLITRMLEVTCRKLWCSVLTASRSPRAAPVIARPNQYAGRTPSGTATRPAMARLGLIIQAAMANPMSCERYSTMRPTSRVTFRTPLRSWYAAMMRSAW